MHDFKHEQTNKTDDINYKILYAENDLLLFNDVTLHIYFNI